MASSNESFSKFNQENRQKLTDKFQQPRDPIHSRPDSEKPVLSFAQQYMWLQYQTDPTSPAYNRPCNLRFRGELQLEALQDALNEIVRRHEVLRSRFPDREGEPSVEILPRLTLKLETINLKEFDAAESEGLIQKWVRKIVQEPFDITRETLVRAKLLHLSDDEHILLLTFHHMVFDDWSQEIFRDELETLYEAFQKGAVPPLVDLPIQYADFAYWQRHELKNDHRQAQLKYWCQQLANVPVLLELPTDRPRPLVKSDAGGKVQWSLDADLARRLKAFSEEQGCTLFMTLMAIFQVLLFRYSGQTDITVGTPIANRNRPEVQEMLGYFSNTLVIRGQITQAAIFKDFLQQIKQTVIDAYHHQDVSFGQLLQSLKPERNLSFTPIFQAFFVLQRKTPAARNWHSLESSSDFAAFDITLHLHEDEDDQITGHWIYSTALFDPVTIERMSGHFRRLIQGILATPTQAISTLPLLTDVERQQLLIEWNDTAVDYPKDKCIHELFEEQVSKTPDAIALRFEKQSLTYRELNHRADQISHYLHSLKVAQESLIGISLRRSPDLVAALLGIFKAGCTYVPLDPTYPTERLKYVIQDSKIALLLTQEELRPLFKEMSVPQSTLNIDCSEISKTESLSVDSTIKPDNLAYVIYTSGSTGNPKGVAVPHRGVVNYLSSMSQSPGFGSDDTFLALTSLSFDIAVGELFLPLVTGGVLLLAREDTVRDGLEIARILDSEQPSYAQATPSTWQLLLHAGWGGAQNLTLVSGGEPLSSSLADALLAKNVRLWNFYGPTEATIFSSFYRVQPQKPISIGNPIQNLQYYVLDEEQQPVPVGIPGELYIGGVGVTRGYWQRPELTTARFTANPFLDNPDSRIYRTGDRVRFLPDGSLQYL
ncbi:MAG: amino acid adenylation domain-containing protein, partial [Cyanobacteria bacterium P01_H01_bin.15]